MKALVFLSFPDKMFFPKQKLFKYFSIGLQMKALKSLLMNRYCICIIVVCGLKVLLNQDQFQRIQKLHSVDLKLEYQSYIDSNFSNHSII